MIADIYNKINGLRLRESSEDNLTGNFFGALRYLPSSMGLSSVMDNISFDSGKFSDGNIVLRKHLSKVVPENYKFWPKFDNGREIDLLIEDGKTFSIGVEVKFQSGLSSDNEVNSDTDLESSLNQLHIYIQQMKKRKSPCLIFIAPYTQGIEIYNRTVKTISSSDIAFFGFLSWEQVYRNLKVVPIDNFPYSLIKQDIINLLCCKGFDVFNGFYRPNSEYDIGKKSWAFSATFFPQAFIGKEKVSNSIWHFHGGLNGAR